MGNNVTGFYVYVIFRPDGSPCYVGKGLRSRWKVHQSGGSHNKHLANIVASAGRELPIVKVRQNLSERDAFEIEIALIAAIGRSPHGPLVNLTDGGDGTTGPKTPEHRAAIGIALRNSPLNGQRAINISKALTGLKKSDEHLANMAAAQVKVWASLSQEERAYRSKIASDTHPWKGGNLPEAHCIAIGNALRNSPKNQERGRKIGDALRGREKTLEHRANLSKSKAGVKTGPMSDDHKSAIRAGLLRAWARRKAQAGLA